MNASALTRPDTGTHEDGVVVTCGCVDNGFRRVFGTPMCEIGFDLLQKFVLDLVSRRLSSDRMGFLVHEQKYVCTNVLKHAPLYRTFSSRKCCSVGVNILFITSLSSTIRPCSPKPGIRSPASLHSLLRGFAVRHVSLSLAAAHTQKRQQTVLMKIYARQSCRDFAMGNLMLFMLCRCFVLFVLASRVAAMRSVRDD